mmetsp:Transcript_23831/g.38816  ORF Transcript_23831/g.38816 Transcript_23831/m.38816 type:complete len:106 (+) Transcript_23831:196-513(+)
MKSMQCRRYLLSLRVFIQYTMHCPILRSTLHYPLDCVRRRLMMEAGKTKSERKYRNTFHCFRRIWAEEGYRGFYLGLQMNLIRCIGSALVLVSYDEFKKVLLKKS